MSEETPRNYVSEVELHLIHAGRELLAAAKGVIEGLDAALELLEQRVESGATPKPIVQPIPIRRNTL